MLNRKIQPTIIVLISTILVFALLLIYLNIVLFELKKEKIETQSQNLISEAFFSTPYNSKGLAKYVQQINDRGINNISSGELQTDLKEIFRAYESVSLDIDTVFNRLGLKLDYEWSITIPKFEIRDSLGSAVLIDSKNINSDDLVLYGKERVSNDASKYVFYKIGTYHFNQINLYIEFLNIYSVIAKQLIAVLIADILLVILFTLAMMHSIKTLIRQQKLVTLQTDLLNAVSHEFNTPLSSIRVGGQALLKLKDHNDQAIIYNVAHGIIRQQQYLKRLVDQILAIGMSENKKSIVDIEIFRADILIDEIRKKWISASTKNNQIVEIEGIPGCDIAVDPHLLELALFNIFDNSVKYADNNTLQIKISGELKRNKLQINILDNGPGIAADELKNVTKKFYRGSAVKKSKGAGLGLGLYLVNQIIKIHKGSCEIKCEKGAGTKVIIILPVKNVG
jgi:signal transduction histidine kinase